MRLVYIATGDIALPAFRHLLAVGPKPLALVSQPDKPVGRRQVLTPPRIKTEAIEAGIPVLQPEVIGDAAEALRELKPDLLVVMAYGQILKRDIIELPRVAIINLHASLLPKYRGAACIQAAIDAGDEETGITAQHVIRKLDAGDLIHTKRLPIAPDETAGSLHDRLAELAVPTLAETIALLESGDAPRTPQQETQATYIGKLGRGDGCLDWTLPAVQLERRIRAYDPWPGTFTTVVDGGASKRLKIFPPTRVSAKDLPVGEVWVEDGEMWVGTGEGSLEIITLQPEGGKRMGVDDYLLGRMPERLI